MHNPVLPGLPGPPGAHGAPAASLSASVALHMTPGTGAVETPAASGGSLPRSERLPVLDIVRGFALMGILIMNMAGFSTSFFAEADGSHLWVSRLDQLAEQLRAMLFSGMFSLLFGIGFTIQYTRMQQTDPLNADRIYLRRLLVLAALGIVHAFIFWPGDVLHTYAILGIFVLFGLKRVSDRGILIGIGACLLYPLPSGLLAGRRRWAQRIPELLPQARCLTWWLLAIGLICGAAFTVIFELNRVPGPSPIKLLGGLCCGINRLAMMLFYVKVIVQLSQRAAWQRLFAPLAAAGRMPLTNYLMQTLICTAIFNGWGLGLYGKIGPAAGFALSLAIFWAVQVPWSLWWLKTHERGPLEALWARLTYGRKPAAAGAVAGR